MNENNYTITLTRYEICNVLLACSHIKHETIYEMTKDPDCSEYRKTVVLPETVKMWEGLHSKIENQLHVNDCGVVFSDLLNKRAHGEISEDELTREMGLWADTLG